MERARNSSGTWVELLVTDSLDRPLEDAPYALDLGATRLTGRLSRDGRVGFELPEAGARLLLAHRTVVLLRGPSEGLAFDRNRLTNLGYDAGSPTDEPERARIELAFRAFESTTRSSGPRATALLEGWYRGLEGVELHGPRAASLRPFRRGFVHRWRARRAEKRAQALRAGSHLGAEAERGGRLARLAVSTGERGSAASQNRIVLFDWFTGFGTPPRTGNEIEILIDGEQAFGRLADDVAAASTELCMTTWFVDPDIELRRPAELALANPERRAPLRLSTAIEALAARGGQVSILLWDWMMTPIVNPTLRRWSTTRDDNIDVLQVRHPLLLGSFHQKTIVVDRAVGYCGGFNLRQNDWDTREHAVGDARRNPHALSGWERKTSEPEYPPRHDVGVRLEGPVVADLHDNFVRQWTANRVHEQRSLRQWLGRIAHVFLGSGTVSAVAPMALAPAPRGDAVVQLVLTEPRKRPSSQAVVDVYLRAIMNARRLIYIENQFFRSPRIADALARALRKHPLLEVIVVTNQVGPPLRFLNPAAHWTRVAQETLRAERPEFSLYELLACGDLHGAAAYRPVFLHAKVMVIDDEWTTIGSANINDRSISTEFEANVAIDGARVATETRRRLMAEHLGLDASDERLADPLEAHALWRELAAGNAAARRARRLAPGRVHPFEQAGSWWRGRPEWF